MDEIAIYSRDLSASEVQWLILCDNVVTDSEAGDTTPPDSDTPPLDESPIAITLDIDPDTLNLSSSGNWITAYIEFPEGYDVAEIDLDTTELRIDGSSIVMTEQSPSEIGDYDEDGVPDLMVKFDRQAVQDAVEPGEVEMEVFGYLMDGVQEFQGTDTVPVIERGNRRR